MQHAAARSVDDEVEGGSEGKEGNEVEGFVGLAGDILLCSFGSLREGGVRQESERGGQQQEDEEGDCSG